MVASRDRTVLARRSPLLAVAVAAALGVGLASPSQAPAQTARTALGTGGSRARVLRRQPPPRTRRVQRLRPRTHPLPLRRFAPRPTPRRSWKTRGEVRDVTTRFASAYRRAAAGSSVLPAEARELVYLVVPGAMGHQVPRYMAKTQRHLESLGLEVHRSRIDTRAGVEKNAATLRDEILALSKGKRSVVLVTHSKGGVDALAADAIYREIRPHLRARVLMQPPWDGTPMADMADGVMARFALRMIGGKAALIADLKGTARRDFAAAHRHSLSVPTVTLATSQHGWSALTPMAARLRRAGKGDSDGVVPSSSQEVPGTHVVRLDRLDHWSTVLEMPGAAYRPGPLAEALLAVALSIR